LPVALKDSHSLISAQIPTHGDPSFLERRHPVLRFWTFIEPDRLRIASARAAENFPNSGPGDGPVTHRAGLTARDQFMLWHAPLAKVEMPDGLLRVGEGDDLSVGK
jgi:hypothetical protein